MTKRQGATSENGFILKYERGKNPMSCFGNNPILSTFIHLDKHLDGARGTLWIKFTKYYSGDKLSHFGYFFSNFMHGLKSAILAIFQKSADWLGPVSAALYFCPKKKKLKYFFSNQLWTKNTFFWVFKMRYKQCVDHYHFDKVLSSFE